ncbi:MAG TPA: LLM class flavin-dependent oxidoreductase [Candidatus Dormibacteraeota bacterium]|nr:LLM class flavin-dependent oxidoreductase [Candidatus Dormibacteraeota bacterium]
MRLALKYDLRAPAFGADIDTLYAACLDQCAAADGWGFERVFILEHHGSGDSYCSSPLTLAAAIAARTNRIRISTGALIAPFHHPLRLAEDLAVLDILSGGRLDVVLGAGYLPSEFDMRSSRATPTWRRSPAHRVWLPPRRTASSPSSASGSPARPRCTTGTWPRSR